MFTFVELPVVSDQLPTPFTRAVLITPTISDFRFEISDLKSQSLRPTQLSAAERLVFFECVQPLGELSSKFAEFARPDRLPDASHSVKEEGQIVVCQQNAGEHFARGVKVTKIGAGVASANGALAGIVERPGVQSPLRVLHVHFPARRKCLAGP